MDKVFDIDSKILSDTLDGLTLTDIERQIILAWFTNPISLYDYAMPCSQKYLYEAKKSNLSTILTSLRTSKGSVSDKTWILTKVLERIECHRTLVPAKWMFCNAASQK